MKPKILIVFDEMGWIFHSHAKQIQERLTEYDIDIIDHRQNITEISKKYDLVYVMDPMPITYPPQNKTIMGLRNEFLYKDHPESVIGLYEKGWSGRCVSIKDKCKLLHMVNKRQIEAFKDIKDKPIILVQHGIDERIFDVNVNKYKKVKNDVLTVGMSGRDSRNKTFGTVKLACDKTGLRFLSAQYNYSRLPKEKMPEFYNKIDVYVVMSLSEGLHNGSMEAGAMKVPIISTKCGAIEEMVTDGESGLLIERNEKSLIEALEKIKDEKLRSDMGNKFHEEIITNWTWEKRIDGFRKMFELGLKI